MVVIGIAGGIASGKSLVSDQLVRLGAEILDADSIGHEVLLESDVIEKARRQWGTGVLDEKNQISRAALAQIVFAPAPKGPEQLSILEQITHPRIEHHLRQQLANLKTEDRVKAVVLDAAIMFKTGWDKLCDKIIFVEVDRQQRLERAIKRGWTESDFTAREAAQESLDKKRNCADWVINNSTSPENAFAQVQEFWHSLA